MEERYEALLSSYPVAPRVLRLRRVGLVFHLFHHICIRRENTELIQQIRTQRKGVREMPKETKEKNIALRHLRGHLQMRQEE